MGAPGQPVEHYEISSHVESCTGAPPATAIVPSLVPGGHHSIADLLQKHGAKE
jgi:hypothetical protein